MRNAKVAKRTSTPPPKGRQVVPQRLGTAEEIAFLILDEQLDQFLAMEKAVREHRDADSVHDMRVASRRIRACIGAFAAFLPPTIAASEPHVKWCFDKLGAVRDFDICLKLLSEECGVDADAREALTDVFRRRRGAALNALVASFDAPRFLEFVREFRAAVKKGPKSTSRLSGVLVLAAAPDLVEAEFRKLRKKGKGLHSGGDPMQFHATRKSGKRFRYSLEFVSDLYPEPCEKLISRLKKLQESLGDRQDQFMLADQLERLANRKDTDAGLAKAASKVAKDALGKTRKLEEDFPKSYAAVTGKAWRQLRKEMLRKRRELWALRS